MTCSIAETDCSALMIPSTSEPREAPDMSLCRWLHGKPKKKKWDSRCDLSRMHCQNRGIAVFSSKLSGHMLRYYQWCGGVNLKEARNPPGAYDSMQPWKLHTRQTWSPTLTEFGHGMNVLYPSSIRKSVADPELLDMNIMAPMGMRVLIRF